MFRLTISFFVCLFLFSGCGAPQSELDEANRKIAELEAKLKLQSAQQVSVNPPVNNVVPMVKDEPQDAASASQWVYGNGEDKMTGKKTFHAIVESTNTVSFSSPYEGEQHATLTIRDNPKYGKDIIFRIEKGQILCHSYNDCNVLVRFDEESPSTYSANPPSDNSSETIFISNYKRFADKINKAKLVRISPTIYQEGNPIFEFNISGFDQDKFKPKK